MKKRKETELLIYVSHMLFWQSFSEFTQKLSTYKKNAEFTVSVFLLQFLQNRETLKFIRWVLEVSVLPGNHLYSLMARSSRTRYITQTLLRLQMRCGYMWLKTAQNVPPWLPSVTNLARCTIFGCRPVRLRDQGRLRRPTLWIQASHLIKVGHSVLIFFFHVLQFLLNPCILPDIGGA